MRKLASVQRITDITPIIGADNIELAYIGAWKSIVKIGEFKVGDLCVFFEPDSILPESETCVNTYASFLANKSYKVKAMKLSKFGVISQGLILPVDILGEMYNYYEGEDVTEYLKVAKIEDIKSNQGDNGGNFPHWISKTDETRLQSVLYILKEMKDQPFYITEKLDGMSCTAYIEDEKLVCTSRNFIWKDGDNAYYRAVRTSGIEKFLLKYPHLALQGEVCGVGINKNRLKLNDYQFFTFNVFDRVENRFLSFGEYLGYIPELNFVPIMAIGNKFNFTFDDLEKMSNYKYSLSNKLAEGIVIRTQDQLYSVKVINPEFLVTPWQAFWSVVQWRHDWGTENIILLQRSNIVLDIN